MISVIIPNYNHYKFLKQRIESVLNQTYQDFELIILDDCSTDDSKQIIEQYRNHPRVSKIVYNETNSGNTFKQWEKGIQLAVGNFIWIAESDDYASPKFLEYGIKAFNSNEHIGIAKFGSVWVDESNATIKTDREQDKTEIFSGKKFIKDHLATDNNIYNASAVLFKKNQIKLPLIKEITSMFYCGDWLFWIEILKHSDICLINKNLNYYRRHPNTVTHKFQESEIFFVEALYIFSQIKSYILSYKLRVRYKNHIIWVSRLVHSKLSSTSKKEIIRKVYRFNMMFSIIWYYHILKKKIS